MRRTHGVTPIDTAKLCFQENRDLFSNRKTTPEQYNLYNGLHQQAIAIEAMQAEIEHLKSVIALLVQELKRR